MMWQFLANGLITGMIYGLVGLGFALVYNTTRIFHIAYAAIYMVSPYILLYFFKGLGLALWLSILVALVGTVIIGLLVEVLVYSPLVKQGSPKNVIIISSIGVMIVLINLVALLFGNETKIIKSGISQSIIVGNVLITHTQLLQFFVSLFILAIFYLFLKYSGFGIKTRALRDDKTLTEVMGVNTVRLKRLLFMLSSFFAAVASCLIAWDVGMNPYVGFPMLLNGVVAMIIGGMGRFESPLLGGILLGVTQALVIYAASARWQEAVTFLILILFLLLRPQGILGEKIRSV